MIDANTVEPLPEAPDFWQSRQVLTHVREHARACRVSPWAALGSTLVRANTVTPPNVVLPALVGTRASLNLFVAVVGPSGAGKDAAEGASRDSIILDDDEIPVVPLGSGEGIARTFRPHGTKPDDPNPVTAAMFTASEIDSWAALATRSGSTLTAEMRKLYTGSSIGFANAGKDTRNVVMANTYRACALLGVQPLRSQPLLAAADGGLPQRIVWVPADDPDAPDRAPQKPEPLKVVTPDWDTAEWVTISGGQTVLSVPATARRQIDAHRLAVLRSDPDIDPLDGHALLTRLKVAASLMILDGHTTISDEDWDLAGSVMEISTATREQCRQALADQTRRSNRARAYDQADREAIIAARLTEDRQQRVAKAITRKLKRVGRAKRTDLRRACDVSIRGDFDVVFDLLVDKELIVPMEGRDGHADEYELSPE